jgi:hypothetical protein
VRADRGVATERAHDRERRAERIERESGAGVGGAQLLVDQHARDRAEAGATERLRQLESRQPHGLETLANGVAHRTRALVLAQRGRELRLGEVTGGALQERQLLAEREVEQARLLARPAPTIAGTRALVDRPTDGSAPECRSSCPRARADARRRGRRSRSPRDSVEGR